MKEQTKKLAEQAGFVLWPDRGPFGEVIDWASSYDMELEKFAELVRDHFSSHTTITQDKSSTKLGTNSGVLYKEWVGLTDEEVADYWVEAFNENGLYVQTFASLIEAKLKEKNT